MGSWILLCFMHTYKVMLALAKLQNRKGLNLSYDATDHQIEKIDCQRITFRPLKMKNCRQSPSDEQTQKVSSEYLEIVSFINHGWSDVKQEMEKGNVSVAYYEETSNPQLASFSPFDLDAWWGRRLYQNLTNGL